jgi:hypothetical protein
VVPCVSAAIVTSVVLESALRVCPVILDRAKNAISRNQPGEFFPVFTDLSAAES